MASSRKSRTLVRHGQGGSWKLLFRDPIQGHNANKPFINQTLLNTLRRQYDLDEESHFELNCVPEGVIYFCHVTRSDEGMGVHELIASLPPYFVLAWLVERCHSLTGIMQQMLMTSFTFDDKSLVCLIILLYFTINMYRSVCLFLDLVILVRKLEKKL